MRKSLLRCLCGFTVAVIAVLSPAKARSDDVEVFTKFEVYLLFLSDLVPKSLAQNLSAAPVANDTRFGTATYVMSNIGATTEPGEPRFGGRMKRTVWGLLAPKRKAKVVIHTIGSDYDTALAVHTGDDVAALTKVAFNDNIAVPGISSVHSLVAFNALAGERYRVQVGSKTDEVGDAYVSLAMLPPAGGLSVTLVAVDGVPFGGRDYNCVIGNGEGNRCGAPTFLLYNSSKRKMRVTAKASLGAGLEVPSKAVLEPGTAATMTFGFAPGFDSATLRSKRGFFTFTAKRGKTFVQRVDVPGLIVVKDKAAGPDVLGAALRSAAVQAAPLQLAVPFELALTNHGSERAFGCHARVDRFVFSTLGRQLFTSDETADPAPATKPFAIAPGRTKTLPIQVAAMNVAGGGHRLSGIRRAACRLCQHGAADLQPQEQFRLFGTRLLGSIAGRRQDLRARG